MVKLRTGAPLTCGLVLTAVLGASGAVAVPTAPSASVPVVVPESVRNSRQAQVLLHRWGIDEVHVRYTASGSLVRFSYRVVNADKAAILNDKKAEPYLLVKKTGKKLQVPETEKVGKLRQVSAPENGREYWMVFTNVGRVLQPGDHVEIVIGSFRADELVVESPR